LAGTVLTKIINKTEEKYFKLSTFKFDFVSEDCSFNPGRCYWNFFIDTKSFRSHYYPGVDSISNRNEDQEHFLEVKAAGG
jgi:hypothetical protein